MEHQAITPTFGLMAFDWWAAHLFFYSKAASDNTNFYVGIMWTVELPSHSSPVDPS